MSEEERTKGVLQRLLDNLRLPSKGFHIGDVRLFRHSSGHLYQRERDGTETDLAAAGGGGAAHNLLDGSVHPDTLAEAAAEDYVVVGNATPKWSRLLVGAQTLLGRITGGHVVGLTATQVRTLINVADGADVTSANAPKAHKDSHDPNDGTDPLDTAAPANIDGVQAAAVGTAHTFARADHAHRIQHAIVDNAIVTIDDAAVAANDFARFTANGLEGLTYAQALAALSGAAAAAFAMNNQKITGLAAATANGDAMRFEQTPKLAGQLGGTVASPTVIGVTETTGPTALTLGAIADGEYLKRTGATVVGGTPAGGSGQNPLFATALVPGVLTTGVKIPYVPAFYAGTATEIFMRVMTRPTGATLKVTVEQRHILNTMVDAAHASQEVIIPDTGAYYKSEAINWTITKDDWFCVNVTQIGSTAAGANLVWQVRP